MTGALPRGDMVIIYPVGPPTLDVHGGRCVEELWMAIGSGIGDVDAEPLPRPDDAAAVVRAHLILAARAWQRRPPKPRGEK